jgi:pyruvate,water dikinase
MTIDPPATSSEIGGKAFNLLRLGKIVPVPAFSVLVFDELDEINEPEVQERILGHFRKTGWSEMAVRSSAAVEDSKSHSFAGMFESRLSVSLDDLIPAIKYVLASAHGERVVAYCISHGVPFENLGMAVIVQRQLPSRVSGVCITRNVTGRGSLIIEAVFGVGELLVSGQVTPDHYILDRRTLTPIIERVGYQRLESRDGIVREVPFYRRTARKLTPNEVLRVGSGCLAIENELDFESADIEWAFEDDNLFFLQVRPFLGAPMRASS